MFFNFVCLFFGVQPHWKAHFNTCNIKVVDDDEDAVSLKTIKEIAPDEDKCVTGLNTQRLHAAIKCWQTQIVLK